MKKLLLFLIAALFAIASSWAQTDFESFSPGTVNYQGTGSTITTPLSYVIPDPYGSLWTVCDEWGFQKSAPAFDQEVKDDGTGNMVWRISNAVTSTGFGDQPNSPSSPLAAGETTSALYNDKGTNHTTPLNPPNPRANAATKYFHGGFKFKSVTGSAQPGLSVMISPIPRQSAYRMSYLSISDNGSTGIDLSFYDTDASAGFSLTTVATDLSYTYWHQIDIYIEFVDGLNGDGSGNDIVTIMLNGNVIHTGTTWETYFASIASPTSPSPIAVDALLFRLAGAANPVALDNGFYFDDVTYDNSPMPLPEPVTYIDQFPATVCGNYDFDVKVQDFTNVGAISLALNYDITKLDYVSFTQNTEILDDIVLLENTPGQLRISYFSLDGTGVTLADDAVLLTLNFNLLPSASGILTDLTWSTVPGDCEYAEPGLDGEVYVSTFTDYSWEIPVRLVKNMNTLLEYCKIQDAIDALPTDNGHVITVAAGVYAENVIVHKSLDIRGPKYGIAGNDGSRGTGEAIVVPAAIAAGGDIFNVTVSNVLIDGFTIDGDNPLLTSGWEGTNSADIDAGKAVTISTSNVNFVSIKNNIIQNVGYFGIFYFGAASSDANASKTGHLIEANLFRDLGHYNTGNGYDSWGGGVLMYNSHYTRVINNVMLNVRTGIQTGNFQTTHLGDPMYQVIDNNQIQARYNGIFYNLHRYSPYTISNNTITGLDDAVQAGLTTRPWRGMLVGSIGNNMGPSTLLNNTIDGSAITLFTTTGKEGINVWNVNADSPLNITGGSISGVDHGIFLNNFEGYASDAGDGAHANISGVTITATGNGIKLYDSPNSTTNANVQATITNCYITGGTDGVYLEETSSGTVTGIVNDNSITGNSGYAINATTITNNVAATCNWYGTTTVSGVAALINGLVTYDPWLIDGSDIGGPGFVPGGTCTGVTDLYVNDGVYDGDDTYTTAIGDDANPGTADAPFLTITKAVNTAVDGTKIWVDAGTFQEQVVIGKTVDITGVDRTKTIVKAPVTMILNTNTSGGNSYSIIYATGNANTINIDKVLVDGDNGRSYSSYVGVHYYAANGAFTNSRITGIRNNPFSGGQGGVAFSANHEYDNDIAQAVTVADNIIDDFQKAGIIINELNTQGIVTGNTVIGQNIPMVNAQNGIQFGWGAYGSITGNTVTNNIWNDVYPARQWTASGILLYGVGVDYTNTPTGNTTTVSGNILDGNEIALSTSAGSYGYDMNSGLVIDPNTFNENKVHVRLGLAGSVLPNAGDTYDKWVKNPDITTHVYGCIQYGIDYASDGHTLNASAGNFVENVLVHRPVTINGSGMGNTIVIPSFSAPNPGGGGSIPAGSSVIFLVEADDVTIQNLTVDGDNPELTSGYLSNGVDVDARLGIVTNHVAGTFDNLKVYYVQMQNIYLRGIYNSTCAVFDFSHNVVTNVAGESSSVAMMNWAGAGLFSYNTVTNSSDGISSNHSKGTTYSFNTVTNCGSGIHTDNNGSSGGNADLIFGNNVSNGPANSWGIWVFASYKNTEVYENTVSGVTVGLSASGQFTGVPLFTRNTITGNQYGVYTTTSLFGWGSSNCNATFTNNFINNNTVVGFQIASETGYTNNTTANENQIAGNLMGVNVTGLGTSNVDMTCNWWGTADGNFIAPMINGDADYIYWLEDGTDNEPVTPGFQPVPGSCTGAPDFTGNYKYFNNAYTPLSSINVELWKNDAKVYPASGTVSTDASGNFTFANVFPDTYEVRSSTSKAVGGINSTDAAQVNFWSVTPSEIEKVRFYAGDVSNDSTIKAGDASNIQAYFLTSGSVGFVRAPWSFWTAGETISANPGSGGYPTLVVPGSGSTVTQNFYGLVTGDFNRSFTPGAKDSGSGSITLQYGQMTEVAYNVTVELPIVSLQDMKIGAVSLILGFPSELMTIENVFLGEDLTNPVLFNVSGDELRVSWHTLSPVSLNSGDRLVTLMVSVAGDAGDEGILFTLAADPLNELADGSYEVIGNAVLSIDILKTSVLGIVSNNTSDMLSLNNYPNPFKGSTTFTYALPVDGRVTLEIYDVVGSKMTVLVDEVQSAGNYRVNMNESMLPSGVYTAKIRLQSSGTVSSRVIKIINR